MTKQTFKLIARTDQETGELGYMVEGTPVINYPMVANEGLLIAHDILEHVNGLESIGSIDDELEALAGVWFVRGQHGMIRKGPQNHRPEEHLSSDILNMARIYNYGVEFKTDVPETTDHEMDDVFKEIINLAKDDIADEIEDDELNQDRVDFYLDACLHYMRQGWDKIAAKFEYQCTCVTTLFWEIADTLDPYMNPDFEGQELELTFDIEHLNVSVEEIKLEDY